jgi:hypothetical protein
LGSRLGSRLGNCLGSHLDRNLAKASLSGKDQPKS